MADMTTRGIQIIIVILGLVGIYYLYQYLNSTSTPTATLLSGKQEGNPQTLPNIVTSTNLPPLYQGGEFSISTWIYVNNWSVNQNMNKSILRIGGSNYDTIRIYLGASQPQLMVRFDNGKGNLTSDDNKFTKLQTGADILDSTSICDAPNINMQRWVHICVVVNGMTCDVYIDGKLTRSCVLPNYFNVDKSYAAYMLDDGTGSPGGFGGYISTTTMYGFSLSPDTIYTNYLGGPEQITSIGQYISSFFSTSK